MRLTLSTILATILLMITACAGSQPPAPTIKAGETVIPAVLGTHCWARSCADYPSPPDHLLAANYRPVTVPGGSTLTVTFPTRPTDPITIHQWDGSKATPSSFVIPAAPGVYSYSISTRWKQGSASYVFQVEVK